MAKRKDYEIIGRLIIDGADVVLEPVGRNGPEGYYLGDKLVAVLKQELSCHEDKETKILRGKLNLIQAKRVLAYMEEDLVELKKGKETKRIQEEGL